MQHVFFGTDGSRPRLRTTPDPLTLRDGEFAYLSNVRVASGVIESRFGDTTLGAIVSASRFRGACVCRFMGVDTIFVAVYIPLAAKVRVYKSTDAVTWTEITKQFNGGIADTGIGPYNLTRLDDDGLVWFEYHQDPDIALLSYPGGSYSRDVLRFGNQSSFPRAYSQFYGGNTAAVTNGSGSLQTAIVEPVPAPTAAQQVGVRARLTQGNVTGFGLADAGNTAYVNSTANFAFADSGASATDNTIVLTVGTAAAVNDTAIIDMAFAHALLSGKQLHLGIDTAWVSFLQSCKIEVGNYNAGFTSAATIWDPSGSTPQPLITVLDTNKKLYSFDVERFASASTYDSLRFTFVGPVVASSKTVTIFYVMPGCSLTYANPGGTLWAITHYNGGSHVESAPAVLRPADYPLRLEAPGLNDLPDSYATLAVPQPEGLFFSFTLPVPNPTQADADKGVEAVRIYRKRPDDDDFYPVESYELAVYSETPGSPPTGPTWSFTGSTAASAMRFILALGREAISTTTPPHSLHLPMPKCRAAISANGRCFAAPTINSQPNFWYSEWNQPSRFVEFDVLDETTGDFFPLAPGAVSMQGDQINGFAVCSAALFGLGQGDGGPTDLALIVFGERELYLSGGKSSEQIRRLTPMGLPGTISPGSIAVGREWVYYVDRYMMPRRLRGGGGDQPIGWQRVEDLLQGVPAANRRYLWGWVHKENYYLAYFQDDYVYSDTVTTPNRILVWDSVTEDWVSDDRPTRAIHGFVSWHDTSIERSRLVAFGDQIGAGQTLVAHEYEDPDSVSSVAVIIRTLSVHSKDWMYVSCGKVGVLMDAVAGVTATIVVTYLTQTDGASTARTTTISLATQTSQATIRRTDRPFESTETSETKGGAFSVEFSASIPGGKRMLGLTAEIVETSTEWEDVDS